MLRLAETGIGGITIYLYNDVNGDGFINGADTVVMTQTTTITGYYLFSNLPPGNWRILVDSSALTGTIQTGDRDGVMDDRTAVTTDGLTPVTDADFGYQPYGAASLGDTVWRDMNGNALQGGGTETRYRQYHRHPVSGRG